MLGLLCLLAPLSVHAGEAVSFASADETPLYADLYRSAAPVGGVLLVHGLQSHAGWFEASGTAAFLAEQGFVTVAYDRRGSGKSGGVRGDTTSAAEFTADFAAALEVLKQALREAGAASVPVHVVANCFATRIAVPYAAAHPAEIASLVLLSPATHMRKNASYGWAEKARILAARDRSTFDTPLRDEDFVPNGAWFAWIRNDELGLRRVTARFLKSANDLTEVMERELFHLELPLLVVLASQDALVDNQAVKSEFYVKYRGPKRLIELPGPHYTDFTPAQAALRRALLDWFLQPMH